MIQVRDLKKNFGPKTAVNGITFTVERGEVLGFLGPNGAGKSTTMRMITGFIPPSEGAISIGGHDIVENPLTGSVATTDSSSRPPAVRHRALRSPSPATE